MSVGAYKYLVKGTFEGTFTTLQNEPLLKSSELPKGDEHKIKIHRGIITNSEEISEEEYQNAVGALAFNEINKIEIQKSEKWPLEYDRIFTLNNAKINDYHITDVEFLNDKTIATIKGTIYSKVSEGNFKDLNFTNNENSNDTKNNQWNDQRWKKDWGFGTGNNGCLPSVPNFNSNGCAGSGCWTWLRWLLIILLVLFLLWLISRCTEFGNKLDCYYKNWKENREIKDLEEAKKELELSMDKTKKTIQPCGQINDPNGKNIPKSYTFDLGETSGTVRIKYNMYQIPDRVEVIYDGELVAVTNDKYFEPVIVNKKKHNLDYLIPMGFAQGEGELKFDYNYDKNKPSELLIRVIPSREFDQTEWTLNIFCP